MAIKILFLIPYPLKRSPSQRFRFEQYFSLLRDKGFEFTASSFLKESQYQVFARKGNTSEKIMALLNGSMRRWRDVFRAPSYNFIFIHREASPVGPPVFEWILKNILKKKIIYDFDDAIWLTDKEKESAFERVLKWRGKVRHICRWAFKVSCSNQYLCNYASAFNSNIVHLPSTVDTEALHNPSLYPTEKKNWRATTIGWTGSYSTLKYLKGLEKVVSEIQSQYPDLTFVVIADRPPSLDVPSLRYIKWNPETEIRDLLRIEIGVMPLSDDRWTKGKSGFKCLQYMALKIPVVAADVGINSQIIDHGITGYLARNPEEWKNYLIKLIDDTHLRERLGEEGRKKILKHYSVIANSDTFLSLFG